MQTETYSPENGFAKGKQNLDAFGTQQNAFNAEVDEKLGLILKELQDIHSEMGFLTERVTALEAAQAQNLKYFDACAKEMKDIRKVMKEMALRVHMHSNSIKRLVNGESDESDEATESTENTGESAE